MTFFMIFITGTNVLFCEVRLPSILSDNMVLQREIILNIWGWAKPGEKVLINFNNQKETTRAGNDGKWKVQLKPMHAGGPYEMTIKGSNEIVLKNILIGDVWVCSGQSNMEFPLNNSRDWGKESDSTNIPNIRLLTITKNTSIKPLEDAVNTKWQLCNVSNAASFSAIGYYFGKYINRHFNVPIGLINSNWGGTDIETWMSMETLANDADYKKKIKDMRLLDFDKLQKQSEIKAKKWMDTVANFDPGILGKWYLPETAVTDWKEMKEPGYWESSGYPNLDGIVWYRKEIDVSDEEAKKGALISLGPIDDNDETYINGQLVGKTNQYDKPRFYFIEPGILKPGKNIICIKIVDTGGGGGFWGKDNEMFLETGTSRKNLSGKWLFKIALDLPAQNVAGSPNAYPSLLFNAMINPLLNFNIKGIIWYQGENNAKNPSKYRTLFPALITNWRTLWQEGDFPFLFVQLASYMAPDDKPVQSNWAELREAQAMTLSLPNTGMAVTIDIGDAYDIHPRNKHDVGYRLFLAARKVAYGEDIVYSGPTYKSISVDGNKIIIDFNNTGSGLAMKDKYGYLKGFAIADADKKFVWAKAYISNNKVIVFNDTILEPVAVRYAWGNNPEDANLYNKEMLPVSPFRTDNW